MRLIPGHVYATGGFNLYYVGTQYAKSRNTPGARVMAAPIDEAEIGNATRWTVSSDSGKLRCFKIGAGAVDAAEDVSVAGAAFENQKMTQKELIAIKKHHGGGQRAGRTPRPPALGTRPVSQELGGAEGCPVTVTSRLTSRDTENLLYLEAGVVVP